MDSCVLITCGHMIHLQSWPLRHSLLVLTLDMYPLENFVLARSSGGLWLAATMPPISVYTVYNIAQPPYMCLARCASLHVPPYMCLPTCASLTVLGDMCLPRPYTYIYVHIMYVLYLCVIRCHNIIKCIHIHVRTCTYMYS